MPPQRLRIVSIVGILISLAAWELFLILVNYPRNSVPPFPPSASFAPHATRGWQHREGSHTLVRVESPLSSPFNVTYLPDGRRRSSEHDRADNPPLILLGCSFTEGFGLSDRDTFAWMLQEKLATYHVENWGVSGYGTIHSLLLLRSLANRAPLHRPGVVVYGFAPFHATRNVKNPLVQRTWEEPFTFPICDEVACSSWSGRKMGSLLESSRLISLMENAWDSAYQATIHAAAARVTERLILDMAREAASQGMRFVVAPVTDLPPAWQAFFKSHNLEVVTCAGTEIACPEYHQPDGHPNEKWSAHFSSCLAEHLTAQAPALP